MVIIMVNVAQRKLPSQKKKFSSVCRHKNFNHQPDHICLSVDKMDSNLQHQVTIEGENGGWGRAQNEVHCNPRIKMPKKTW